MSTLKKIQALRGQKPAAPPKPPAAAAAPAQQDQLLAAQLRERLADLDRQRAIEAAQAAERIAKLEADARAREQQERQRAMRDAVRSAAKKAQARNEDDVADLLIARGALKMASDGKVLVVDKPEQSVESFVADYLTQNAHFLAPKTQPGGGASPFPQAPATGAPPTDLSTAEGMTAYARGLTHKAPPAPPTQPKG